MRADPTGPKRAPPFTDVSGQLETARHHAYEWKDALDHGFQYLVTGQAWGDVDRDGDPDLYLTEQRGRNTLYRNQRGRLTR